METWRVVPGHPGYMVSDQGRVKSLAHTRVRRHPKTGEVTRFEYAERVLAGVQRHGYLHFNLDGRVYVGHRLVLMAFVGPRPVGMEGCHNNGVRDDNRLANLRWDSPKANAADRSRHGTQARGEQHVSTRIPEALAEEIRAGKLTLGGARAMGVSQTHYYRIKNGEGRKRPSDFAADVEHA